MLNCLFPRTSDLCAEKRPSGLCFNRKTAGRSAWLAAWRANRKSHHTFYKGEEMNMKWVCLKIVYPYTQWLMIIIPTKWL